MGFDKSELPLMYQHAAAFSVCIYDTEPLTGQKFLKETKSKGIKYAISAVQNTIFVVVRGSVANSKNWMSNGNLMTMELDESGYFVHKGYASICALIFDELWVEIEKVIFQNQSICKIMFVGHSLGGSVAHILHFKALVKQKNYYRHDSLNGISPRSHELAFISIGFGSPYWLDKESSSDFEFMDKRSFITFVIENDPVPALMEIGQSRGLSDFHTRQPLTTSSNASSFSIAVVDLMLKIKLSSFTAFGEYVLFVTNDLKILSEPSQVTKELLKFNLSGNLVNNVIQHSMAGYKDQICYYFGNGEHQGSNKKKVQEMVLRKMSELIGEKSLNPTEKGFLKL
jgi:hypothetical protein